MLYLEFNKPNKQNVSEINLSKKSTLPNVKTTVETLIEISEIKYITLLSDTNVPVRFRAQQRAKYS